MQLFVMNYHPVYITYYYCCIILPFLHHENEYPTSSFTPLRTHHLISMFEPNQVTCDIWFEEIANNSDLQCLPKIFEYLYLGFMYIK